MIHYQLIHRFLTTLFYSWGSESCPEVTWAANDYLKVLEYQYNYTFKNTFSESFDVNIPNNNFEVVLEEIKSIIVKD
jgi:hypothetical protein